MEINFPQVGLGRKRAGLNFRLRLGRIKPALVRSSPTWGKLSPKKHSVNTQL